MAPYRLIYWNKRGRGEQVRLFLHELDLPYDDVHVTAGSDDFRALQARKPRELTFGSVPMLDDGGFHLCQGPVILSYLARKHGAAPDDLQSAARADELAWGAEDLRSEYFRLFGAEGAARQATFVGGRWAERWLPAFDDMLRGPFFLGADLTHADVAIFDALDAILTWVPGATLDAHPRLAAFYQAVRSRPRIAAYLASPRRANG